MRVLGLLGVSLFFLSACSAGDGAEDDADLSRGEGGNAAAEPGSGSSTSTLKLEAATGGNEASPPAVCGDGALAAGEACDDGNTSGGDGCSALCDAIEEGFTCLRPGFACSACGDGVLDKGETCDDGNALNGDGCSASCDAVEEGYSCPFPGEVCVTCGDGKVDLGESCDDGNYLDGDGCSSTCQQEEGYLCRAPGEKCEQCGDGIVDVFEQCDDGNRAPFDGCDAACLLEPGWDCGKEDAPCAASRCGDGYQAGDEACDDGNALSGDGCNIRCELEAGYVCIAGAPCRAALCGDGAVEGDEECDDAGALGPGCDDACQLELGYVCSTPGAACAEATCGDGVVEGSEACDDAGAQSAGCDDDCQVEAGYHCPLPGTACVATVCGDGKIEGTETCDTGIGPGEGCSSSCQEEALYSCDEAGCDKVIEFIQIASFPSPVNEMQAVHYDPRTRSFVGYDATSGGGTEFCTDGSVLPSKRSRYDLGAGLDGATYDPFSDSFLFVTRTPAVLYSVSRAGVVSEVDLRNHRDNTSWVPGGVTVADGGEIYITDQCGGATACGPDAAGDNSYNIHVYDRADFEVAVAGGTVPYIPPPEPEPAPEGTCTQACWDLGTAWAEGNQVQSSGKIYQCLPWPNSGWCGGGNSAYEPGVGGAWSDAWVEVSVSCDYDASCGEIASGPLPAATIRPSETIEVDTALAWLDTLFSIPGHDLVGIYDNLHLSPTGSPDYQVALYDQNSERVLESAIGSNTELFVSGSPVTSSGSGRADGGETAQDGGYFLLCSEVGGSCQLFAQSCSDDSDCAERLPGTICNRSAPVSGKGYCQVEATARDDGYEIPFNSPVVTLDVTLNDTASASCTGEPPKVQSVLSGDQGGTMDVSSDGYGVDYQPAAGFCGVETFSYRADLHGGETDLAVVKVYVACECGNGIVEPGEHCEIGEPSCSDSCHWQLVCGDGRVGPGEQCDDGGTASGDGCSPNCTFESLCGDGFAEGLEECDDGNGYSGDSCRSDCTLVRCGDGVHDANEGCDDGNLNDGDGCSSFCQVEVK